MRPDIAELFQVMASLPDERFQRDAAFALEAFSANGTDIISSSTSFTHFFLETVRNDVVAMGGAEPLKILVLSSDNDVSLSLCRRNNGLQYGTSIGKRGRSEGIL